MSVGSCLTSLCVARSTQCNSSLAQTCNGDVPSRNVAMKSDSFLATGSLRSPAYPRKDRPFCVRLDEITDID
jgi:hypothetical protein